MVISKMGELELTIAYSTGRRQNLKNESRISVSGGTSSNPSLQKRAEGREQKKHVKR